MAEQFKNKGIEREFEEGEVAVGEVGSSGGFPTPSTTTTTANAITTTTNSMTSAQSADVIHPLPAFVFQSSPPAPVAVAAFQFAPFGGAYQVQ